MSRLDSARLIATAVVALRVSGVGKGAAELPGICLVKRVLGWIVSAGSS